MNKPVCKSKTTVRIRELVFIIFIYRFTVPTINERLNLFSVHVVLTCLNLVSGIHLPQIRYLNYRWVHVTKQELSCN